MKRLHIVGRKKHGKTALMVDLARELTARGLSVGTIKHSAHLHEVDNPGRDSHRHREAGARPAAIVTPDTIGVFLARRDDFDPYGLLQPLYRKCDVVLVEGDHQAPAAKIEVWRAALETEPLALVQDDILAVVTDDPLESPVPCWPRSDIETVADRVMELVEYQG